MKKLFVFIKQEKRFLMAASAIFLVLFALLPWFSRAFYQASKRLAEKETQRAYAALVQEPQALLAHARTLADGGALQEYIERQDILNLTAFLEGEQERRGVDNILVTDSAGVALTRTKSLAKRGDFIFQTTNWGRALGQGEAVATVDEGMLWPLVVVGGHPIGDAEDIKGVVVVQNVLDSAYAKRFAGSHLKDGAQLAWYTRERGIVGDSFEDEGIKTLLTAHFSSGSDLVQGAHRDEEVIIKGDGYLVQSIIFEGEEESPGGMLVFFPRHFWYQGAIFSVILTLIFFLLALLAFSRAPSHEHFRILAASGAVFFLVALIISMRTLQRFAVLLVPPSYTIYNSTMEFDPAVGILDLKDEHRLAIKIITGGETINAAQAVVEFDPVVTTVADVITTHSFCPPDFFLEKTIDNAKGRVAIACAVPNPGFDKQTGILAELLIDPVSEGDLTLRFGVDSQVLAHDGLGTDVLRVATPASFRIALSDRVEAGTRSAALPSPLVFSPTHPNSERWYHKGKVAFSWRPLQGYEYFYAFNQIPDFNPGRDQATRKGTLTFDVKKDGVYFFHLVAVQGERKSAPAHFRVKIDKSAPEAPTIQAGATRMKVGEVVRFTFAGRDALSGLQKNFYVKVDDSLFLPTSPAWATSFMEPGTHAVTLRTFDYAGNFTDTKVEVMVK